MQDRLTDNMLMSFLVAYPGTAAVIFEVWAAQMKKLLAANSQNFSQVTGAIN
jgi:hypothetical protein